VKPSIFNDVLGPVMRGPSSSHTAASLRIGTIARQLCPHEPRDVLVEFHSGGPLATTYEGQGSAMGLTSGLLGLSILDRSMTRHNELARERGLKIDFKVADYEASHPNTYRITIDGHGHAPLRITALSTGGGMIQVVSIDDFEVSICGDYFETLIRCDSSSAETIERFRRTLSDRLPQAQIVLLRRGDTGFLFQCRSGKPLPHVISDVFSGYAGTRWIRHLEPVLPIPSGSEQPLPFTSVEEIMASGEFRSCDLAELAVRYESARAGVEPSKILSLTEEIAGHIRSSIETGMKGTVYRDRILGQQSHLMLKAEQEKKIFAMPFNTVIAYVTAIMEAKSAMEIIVAVPTAGSCGTLGGTIYGIEKHFPARQEDIMKAFIAAGLIGVFIAGKYTFAAEEGGCQVESGAAAAMTAAGLVQLLGGSALQGLNAASMALQNSLGLICDPVAGRVEVPCLGKNILAAANALGCAHMSMAGFDPVIPLNEVIDTMKSVGAAMPRSLCCTGLGGLSVTPTSQRIHIELQRKGN
jgi:L-serine dehydratase